jgi:hypothetical protein
VFSHRKKKRARSRPTRLVPGPRTGSLRQEIPPFSPSFRVTTPGVSLFFNYFSNFKEIFQTDVCFFCFLCYTKHNIELLCERKEALHEETDTYAPEDSGVRIRVHP